MKQSIRRNLTFTFFGLALLPLLVQGVMHAVHILDVHVETAYQHRLEVAKRLAIEVERKFSAVELELGSLLRYRDFAVLDAVAQQALVEEAMKRRDLFDEIAVLDAQGYEQVKVSARRMLLPADLGNSCDNPRFYEALDSVSPWYGEVRFSDLHAEPTVALSLPFGRAGATASGVLTADVRLKAIWELIAAQRLQPGGQAYLLDDQMRLIAHRNPSLVLREHRFAPTAEQLQTGLGGELVVLASWPVRVGQHHFTMVAERTFSEVIQPSLIDQQLNLLFLLAVFAAISLLIVGARRRVTDPIAELQSVVSAVSRGDLQRRVTVRRDDEFGALGSAFNTMAERLQRSLHELEQSEARYRLLVENQNDLVVKFNSEWQFLYVSPSYCQVFGKREDELLGHGFFSLIHEDDRPRIVESLRSLKMPPHRASHEERALTVDGWRWFAWSARALVDGAGEIEQVISVGRDITDRKQAEQALRDNEEQIRLLLESTGEGVFGINVEGLCTFCNPAAARLFGYDDPTKLVGQHMHRLTHHHRGDGSEYPEDECPIYQVFGHGIPAHVTGEVFWHVDGAMFPVEYGAYPLNSDSGVVGVVVNFSDISERMRSEERMRQSSVVFDNAAEAIMVMDAGRRLLSVNAAFCDITGYSEDELLGRDASLLRSNRHDEGFYRMIRASIRETGRWQGEIWSQRKNSDVFPAWLTLSEVRDPAGRLQNYVGVFADISMIKMSQQELEHMAHHDPLTSLPNRLLFNIRLEHSLARSRRDGVRVGVLFLDLDRFKDVNDTLGHTVGDVLLALVAERLSSVVREEDTVARLGGDEFGVILEELRQDTDASLVAEKLIRVLSTPFDVEGHRVEVGASIGISIGPDDGDDVTTLLKNADVAMYSAKNDGRGMYHFYQREMTHAVVRRLAMEAALRRALDKGELEVWYQPQIDLFSRKVVGAEALVRWRDPEQGLISPVEFIPLAEESGLIIPLGEWVLEQACSQTFAWRRAGLLLQSISVNVAGQQIGSGNFVDTVSRVLSKTGLTPAVLELEITEGFIMYNADHALSVMRGLRALGVSTAIDDFGTGYSSLGYLKQLPIDKLKIDQSFVRDLPADQDDVAISRAVIMLGQSLGFHVIAEGIETEGQVAFLRGEGCRMGQGYLFSRPLPAKEFEAYLADNL